MEQYAPILILPAALLLDLALGEPPGCCHPVCHFGRWARLMERTWKRLLDKTFLAGSLAALCAVLPPVCLGAGIVLLAAAVLPSWAAWCAAALAVYLCMAPRSLAAHARRVLSAARENDLPQAKRKVSMIVGRDTQTLDMHGVLRAAIESVSENLTDGILSTLFWATIGLLLGGPAGCAAAAILHRCFNTLDALWGKKNDEYRRFGTFAARTDDALNYLPARLSLPLIALSCIPIPGMRSRRSLSIGWKYRSAHASPNSAWSEAAFAGALGLKLGGPVAYKGIPAPYPYIGEGRMDARPGDLSRSIVLMYAATCIATALFTLGTACF